MGAILHQEREGANIKSWNRNEINLPTLVADISPALKDFLLKPAFEDLEDEQI